MSNILFIGDLRDANNYGAVATTECLIRMVKDRCPDADYRYIACRSLYSPTPESGLRPCKPKKRHGLSKARLTKMIGNMLPIAIKKPLRKMLGINEGQPDFVPYKFCQYERYYQLMMSGGGLQYERRLLEWADVVYINGEGNIVNGTDKYGKYRMGARYILFMAWVSKVKFGRPTCIVNHTVDPNNSNAFEMISNVYPLLDKVFVRESLSLPLLAQHGVRNAEFVPDALFSYKPGDAWQPSESISRQIDFSRPYICLGDSSGIRNGYSSVKWDVADVLGEITDRLRTLVPQIIFVDGYDGTNSEINTVIRKKCDGYVNISNCTYHDLYHVLGHAQAFISGRWHASILSIIAGTPVVLWGADSHKTRSLYTLLDYPYRFFEVSTLPVNIDELTEEVGKVIKNTENIQKIMHQKVSEFAELTCRNAAVLNEMLSKVQSAEKV